MFILFLILQLAIGWKEGAYTVYSEGVCVIENEVSTLSLPTEAEFLNGDPITEVLTAATVLLAWPSQPRSADSE